MSQIIQKIERGPFDEMFFLEKRLTMSEKLKGGAFGIFQHPFCRKTPKIEPFLGPFWGIRKKSLNAERTERGDPSVSPCIVLRG